MHVTRDGLPVGVQPPAAFGDDAVLLQLAAQIEAAQPWVDLLPTSGRCDPSGTWRPLLRLAFAHRVAPGSPGELADGLSSSGVLWALSTSRRDIRATADGVPVVFHDQSLNRVTDRVGRIRICLSARSGRRASAMPSGCIRCRRSWRVPAGASTSTSWRTTPSPAARLTQRWSPPGPCVYRVVLLEPAAARACSVRRRGVPAFAPQEVTALAGRTRLGRVSGGVLVRAAQRADMCSGAALGVRLADRHCGLHAPGPRTRMARSRVDGRRPGTDAWSAGSGSARDHHRPTQCVAAGDRRSDRRKCGGLSSTTDQRADEYPHLPS